MPISALDFMGEVTLNTRRKAAEILVAVEQAGFTINTIWGYNPDSKPEHSSRRALDFMCSREAGDWIAEYVWKNRERLHVQHVIWRQRIISVPRSREGWRQMADRGSLTQNHFDHVHIFFNVSDQYSPIVGKPEPVKPLPNSSPWGVQRLNFHGFDRHDASILNLCEFQMVRMGLTNCLGNIDDATQRALARPRFTASLSHATQHFTPVDVRTLKFATLKAGVAPPDAIRSPLWWTADLSRSEDPSKDVGRWYTEAQGNWQTRIGEPYKVPLSLSQWKRLGEATGVFVGV